MRASWLRLLAAPLALALGVWALATIRFQVELLPLFPAQLPTVRGLALLESVFGSAQELTIVLEDPPAELPARLEEALRALPAVRAVGTVGANDFTAALNQVGWLLVNLSPERFAEFQALLEPAALRDQLAATRARLAGAVDGEDVARLQLDPLDLLTWLQSASGGAGFAPSLPDESAGPAIVALAVQSATPLKTFWDYQQFVDAARAVVTATLPDPAPVYHLTGRAAFMAENSRQMERDMWKMFAIAVGLISLAFWLFYRSWRALAWVIGLQTLSILVALTVGRLAFGELNVISIGFAAILLGVGMDYFILVYHFFGSPAAALDSPYWRVLRRAIRLSAVTTAAAFGMLALSRFPGLQQLAALIAAGLLASAWFATELFPLVLLRKRPVVPAWLPRASDAAAAWIERRRRAILAGLAALLLAVIALWPLWRQHDFYNADLRALRPPRSEATTGLERLMQALPRGADTLETIITADSLPALRATAERLGATAPLLPLADQLAANRAAWRVDRAPAVRAAMADAGFEGDWSRGVGALLETLDAWQAGAERFAAAQLLLANVAELPDGRVGAALRLPGPWSAIAAREPTALPANWDLLTADLAALARADFQKLSLGVLLAVVALCAWAHRSWRLVLLNLAALALALLGLLLLLWATNQSLTLLSLLAVPLLIGLIIDISLHLVLGLEETGGDLRATFRHMAAPVVLTGLCVMIGFGAPALTGQPALRNFGMAMDMGIVSAVVAGLVALPALYLTRARRTHYSATLYRAPWFELAAWVGGRLGPRITRGIAWLLAVGFDLTHPQTRRVARENLSLLRAAPATAAMARRTVRNFGRTLADYFLLGTRSRAEALALTEELIGMEHLEAGLQGGRGVILVTAHLGLFEYGAIWMEERGHPTTVLTLPEPSRALSEWRAAYRKRWGAETVEVGEGLWGSVEIVRLLKQGRSVALLIDRPYGGKFVPVEFPGGPAPFSTGPVWLSLLSGSPIVAVTAVRLPSGRYRLEALPPVRPQWLPVGRDETVRHYTRELGGLFRDVICRHPEQWYQFVRLKI